MTTALSRLILCSLKVVYAFWTRFSVIPHKLAETVNTMSEILTDPFAQNKACESARTMHFLNIPGFSAL
jgi:hypothetical protein